MLRDKNQLNKNVYIVSLICVVVFLTLSAVVNYFTWTAGSEDTTNIFFIGMWVFLYSPLYVFCKQFSWQVEEFGLALNYKVYILISIVFALTIIKFNSLDFGGWYNSVVEMFARTGEELFFRGFLITLFFKMFQGKNRPMVRAVILSSVCFSLVHTQTFLPTYSSTMLDIFFLSVVLALFRLWTNSILPGVVIHVLIKSNFLGVIVGVCLYILIILISRFKTRGKGAFQIK